MKGQYHFLKNESQENYHILFPLLNLFLIHQHPVLVLFQSLWFTGHLISYIHIIAHFQSVNKAGFLVF